MIKRTVKHVVEVHTQGNKDEWDLEAILDFAQSSMVKEDTIALDDLEGKDPQEIMDYLDKRAEEVYAEKQHQLPDPEQMLEFEKVCILRVVDTQWTDHIDEMDQLRQSSDCGVTDS